MINNTTKVNLSNGVDFSRIRRHASGGIAKFQKPASGITHKEGTSWRTHMFDLFRTELSKLLSTRTKPDGTQLTPEEYKQVWLALNDMLAVYAKLRQANPNLTPAEMLEEVKAYQQAIIDKYPFVNTLGVSYGLKTDSQRYVFGQTDPTKRTTGDKADANGNWKADGYWSGQTQDRTLLGYRGDWDEDKDEFKNWQKELNEYGLETYLDTDGAYKLRELPSKTTPPRTTTPPTTPTTTPPTTPPGTVPGTETKRTYTPVTYPEPFKYKRDIYTGILPKAAILGNNLLGATRDFNLEMQKKVPLQEALHHEFITGNNKTYTDLYNNSAADLQSQANSIASQTSNLELNLAMQLEGARQADQQRLQGQLAKAQGYEADRQKALETANWNNDQSTATANANRQNLVADYNAKIAAKQELNLKKTSEISDFINKESTDFRNWYTDQKQNEAVARNDYNQYLADLDMLRAKKDYYDLASDPSKSTSFKNAYTTAFNSYNSNLATADADLDDTGKEARTFFSQYEDENGSLTKSQEELMSLFYNYLSSNNSSVLGKDYHTNLNTELTNAENKTIKDQLAIQQGLQLANSKFRSTYNTGSAWLPWRSEGGTYTSIYQKNGGVLKAANGSSIEKRLEIRRKTNADRERMRLQALKLNSEVEARSLKNAQIAARELHSALKRELDSLDKETLILLRSVFK